jgi:hypothetical protein
VERAGSRYVDVTKTSLMIWAHSVEDPATAVSAAPRYLLWADNDMFHEPPAELNCPDLRLVARFTPPPDQRHLLGPLSRLPGYLPDTYPPASLYFIPRECG